MTVSPIQLRTLVLRFSTPIDMWEIPELRGAVIKATGAQSLFFHNHEGEKLRYAYPLVQYKRIGGKAAIVFVGDGVEAAADYFKSNTVEAMLGARPVRLELEHADAHVTTVNTWDDSFHYSIRKCLPLNQCNYAAYTHTDSLTERYAIIERAMTGNILSMAKGVGLHIDGRISLTLTASHNHRKYEYKGVNMLGFDLEFDTNVSLPDYIGLGKGASRGFGTIKRIHPTTNNLQQR